MSALGELYLLVMFSIVVKCNRWLQWKKTEQGRIKVQSASIWWLWFTYLECSICTDWQSVATQEISVGWLIMVAPWSTSWQLGPTKLSCMMELCVWMHNKLKADVYSWGTYCTMIFSFLFLIVSKGLSCLSCFDHFSITTFAFPSLIFQWSQKG